MVRRRSEDSDLDGAVRVDDVYEQRLVVVVVRVGGYDERDAEVDGASGTDVVVIERL